MKKNKIRRRESYDDKTEEIEPRKGGRHASREEGPDPGQDWRETDPHAASEAQRYAHPLPSRTHIQRTVEESREGATLDELIARFGLKKLNEQEALAKRLVAMRRDGALLQDRFGAYTVAGQEPATAEAPPPVAPVVAAPAIERKGSFMERMMASGMQAMSAAVSSRRSVEPVPPVLEKRVPANPPGVVDGRVTAHRDGYGFVVGDEGGADVFLPPPEMRGVIDGDRVRVRVTNADSRGRREGVLVEVIERGSRQWVGRFQAASSGRGGAVFTVIPSSPKLPEVLVQPEDRGAAKPGQMVVVDLLPQAHARAMQTGRVIEVLGDHLAPGMEIVAAIRTHNLPSEWPAGVEEEAAEFGASVTSKQTAGRADLRELGLMTIDGADARDFDDAVYAEPSRNGGWKLWVAIADVSAYVQPGTRLDAEATHRGNSVYFPDNVIPMLPEALSNGLCSLNPKVDRLCMVCEMRVDADGSVSKAKFYEAVMRSKARLIYEDVAAMLEDPQSAQARAQPELLPPLQTLRAVFAALFAAREKRGAIDFEGGETKIVFDAERKIEKIVAIKRNLAHRLIEECMIAANVEAAKLVDKHAMPALYRVHASPDADKIALLREFLAARGLRLPGGTVPSAKDFSAALAQLKGRPDAGVVQNVMLRSMMQARYSPANDGHFGLALSHYAHFTSPIRRYPDLLLHRAIKHVLARGKPKTFAYTPRQLELLGAQCSTTERRADEAMRDVATWLKCEFMSHRVGEEFPGIITSVAPFGLFVELESLFIDGLVHVSNLGDDYYEYDARHQRLVGSRNGKVFALGEPVQVKVVRVSLDERKIDLQVVGGKSSRGSRPDQGAKGARGQDRRGDSGPRGGQKQRRRR